MNRYAPSVLQVLGMVLFSVALGIVEVWLGLAAFGLLITIFGLALELGSRSKDGTSGPGQP